MSGDSSFINLHVILYYATPCSNWVMNPNVYIESVMNLLSALDEGGFELKIEGIGSLLNQGSSKCHYRLIFRLSMNCLSVP